MYLDKKGVVIMPASNAAKMLRKTYDDVMAQGVVDLVIVVDDASRDETVELAVCFWSGLRFGSLDYCRAVACRHAADLLSALSLYDTESLPHGDFVIASL